MRVFTAIILLSSVLISCGKKNETIPVDQLSQYGVHYVWFENLSFRDAPGLDSSILDTMDYGEKVYFLNEISEETTTVTVKCKQYTDHFIKIAREDGSVGWTYAGGVTSEEIDIPDGPVRVIVAFTPDSFDSESVNEFIQYMKNKFFPSLPKDIYTVFVTNKLERLCVPVGDAQYPISSIQITDFLKEEFGYTATPGFFIMEEGFEPLFFEYDPTKTGLYKSYVEHYYEIEF